MNSLWPKLFLIPIYLFITAIPLAGVIGANLEYEYDLIVGWLCLLLIPLVGVILPDRYLPRQDGRFYVAPAMEFFWICFVGPAIALLSPVYIFLAGLCPCSKTGFTFWFVLNVWPAWLLAHAIFWMILRARVRGASRRKVGLCFVLLIAALSLFDAGRLWFYPQKRLVSFFSGFLHGPIYDDWIAVDHGIALARLSHLLLAGALLVLAWLQPKKGLIAALVVLTVGWFGAGYAASRFPSTRNGKASLDRHFAGRIERDGFTLHYVKKPKLKKDEHPLKYLRLARDTAFHLSELTPYLNGKKAPHIHVYVYPNDQLKKLWFGGGSTDVADVYTPSIHIDDDHWPHPTLRHELVHALFSGVGFHGLGFHPNMAFTEGLAVALAPDGRSISLDDGAAAVIEGGRVKSVDRLFSPLFWQVSGGRAYTVAGSFIRYLIDSAGIAKVEALYAGKSFNKVFGKDRDKVIDDWRSQILSHYDKDKHAVFAEALFRYPGVFADKCPHSKEDLSRRRDKDIYVRLRQPLKWDPVQDYLPWRMDLDGKDRASLLNLWRQDIREVATSRVPTIARLETWSEALHHFRNDPPKELEDVEAGILESDILRLLGKDNDSLQLLSSLQEADKKTFFGFSLEREIAARLSVEQNLAPDNALEWRKFLAGWRKQMPEEHLFAGPWILTYLKLRNVKASRLATAELEQAYAMPQPGEELPETFKHEWYKLLGTKFMQRERYDLAASSYAMAEKSAQGSLAELMNEQSRRAAYYAKLGRFVPAEEVEAQPPSTEQN